MNKKRIIASLCVFLLVLVPVWAVFKEKNLQQTLSVLLLELKETYNTLLNFNGSAEKRIQEQHERLADLIDECNELSVILYSQASENTFDLTFALNEVTKQYEQFKSEQTPYAAIKASLSTEMERYNRMLVTLRKMPPERTAEEIEQAPEVAVALDSAMMSSLADSSLVIRDTPVFAKEAYELKMDDETIAVRDSCLYVTEQIVAYYWMQLQQIEKDSEYYTQTDELLRGAYDYAQERYKIVQRKLFVEGQGNYFKTLKSFPRRFKRALADIKSRYSLRMDKYKSDSIISSWRGPVIFIFSFQLLAILLVAIMLATLIINVGFKKTRFWGKDWFMDHKGMIIALIGSIIFLFFLGYTTRTAQNTFIIRSSKVMGEFAWLISAIFASMLIRLDRSRNRSTLLAYVPTLTMAFLVIYFRIIFIPNSVINLVFPAVVLLSTLWQFWMNFRQQSKVARGDRILLWVSAAAMAISTLMSWAGMVMGALLFLIWWMFMLAFLEAVIAVAELLDRYNDNSIKQKKATYRSKHPDLPLSSAKGSFIEVTWLYDLCRMTLVPLLGIWSFPGAVFMACNVFNFNTVAHDIFFHPFIHSGDDGTGFTVSLFNIILIISLFFLFRYIVYAAKAFYRVWRTRSAIRKLGENVAFKETDINFNLANNVITLLVWGLYVVIIFIMLQIPASGLALISTGLATGIGFAMKDVLNNFFYGIQLMSGRVRVGDVVECDGIRGTVVGLSYQSTQIEAIDGSIIIFTNTALFNKNFKNLTRNNSYQLVTLTVGVAYGTDVDKARQIILDALEPLMIKDKYGRELVDKKRGVTVRLQDFGDSSVDLLVIMHVVVDSYAVFAGKAREAIYNAFAANGIEIPFPQRDVYIKEAPKG